MSSQVLTIERTGRTLARATLPQEYFWYLRQSDPEPSSYAMWLSLALEGPLDHTALQAAVEASIARHDMFRTALREIDGALFQIVLPQAPRFELEVEDRSALPESERAGEVVRVEVELIASGLDLASGRTIRGRLVKFGPRTHALILVIHHAVSDAASVFMLQREILRSYRRGGAVTEEPPPLQYADYAEALDRFAMSPAGQAWRAWWQEQLRGVRPIALPVDLPRDEHDARRAAAPLGIIADPMLPTLSIEVPATTRARIARAAAEEGTSPSLVYLAAYVWCLCEASAQDDLCIEYLHNPRAEYCVEQLQGAVVAWTIMRCRVAGCATLREAIRTIAPVVVDALAHTPVPAYFETVPREIRGVTFNYMPMAWGRAPKIGELEVRRWPGRFPRFRRHWELMLFVVDSTQRGVLHFTADQQLFRPETIEAFAHRYLSILEQELA